MGVKGLRNGKNAISESIETHDLVKVTVFSTDSFNGFRLAWREGTLLSPIHNNNKTCSVKPGLTERKSATAKRKTKVCKEGSERG